MTTTPTREDYEKLAAMFEAMEREARSCADRDTSKALWQTMCFARRVGKLDAPPAPAAFKVGDHVIVSLDDNDRERGKIGAICANGYGVDLDDGARVWALPSSIEPIAPAADGLSEGDAEWLQAEADRWQPPQASAMRSIASRISAALSERDTLRAELAKAQERAEIAETNNESANGAWVSLCWHLGLTEGGMILEDAIEAVDTLRAENERLRPRDLPASARDAARRRVPLGGADVQALEHAITITEKERDDLRAKLAEAEREREEAKRSATSWKAHLDDAERKLDVLAADNESLRSRLVATVAERDEAIAKLGTMTAIVGKWRGWAKQHAGITESDEADRAAIDQKLAARAQPRAGLREGFEAAARWLRVEEHAFASAHALEQHAATLPESGGVFTEQDAATIRQAAARAGFATRDELRDLASRIEAFLGAR